MTDITTYHLFCHFTACQKLKCSLSVTQWPYMCGDSISIQDQVVSGLEYKFEYKAEVVG